MSDVAPGWWQASDGQWYPPDTHPDYEPQPAPAVPTRPADLAPKQVPNTPESTDDAEVGDDGDPEDDDPTYVDADGVDWWWDGRLWNYWGDDDWIEFPGQLPAGLIEVDESVPLNLRPMPSGYGRAADGRIYPLGPGGPASPTSAAAVVRAPDSTVPAGGWLAIAGGLILAIGTLLPWVTLGLGNLTRNGFQMGQNDSVSIDGPLLLTLGVVTVIIGITRLTGTAMPAWIARSTIWTGLIAGISLWADHSGLQDLVSKAQGLQITAAIGYGYWICAVGAGIAVVAGFVLNSND